MQPYETTFTLKFRQTDMAGIGYFTQPLDIFHDAYEDWAKSLCGSKNKWFNNEEWAVPLKKIECEYFRPLQAFKKYLLRISVDAIGQSSFTLKTEIIRDATVCCLITTSHVFMSRTTFKATDIPFDILDQIRPPE